MENAVRISVPVWVTILIITVVFSAFGGMEPECKDLYGTGK